MRLRCRFADQDFTIACRQPDLSATRLAVAIEPDDRGFSTNEKIAHLPRRLDEGGLADFDDEAPADLCYFRGWGNLAFFHDDYRYAATADPARPASRAVSSHCWCAANSRCALN